MYFRFGAFYVCTTVLPFNGRKSLQGKHVSRKSNKHSRHYPLSCTTTPLSSPFLSLSESPLSLTLSLSTFQLQKSDSLPRSREISVYVHVTGNRDKISTVTQQQRLPRITFPRYEQALPVMFLNMLRQIPIIPCKMGPTSGFEMKIQKRSVILQHLDDSSDNGVFSSNPVIISASLLNIEHQSIIAFFVSH